MVAVTDELDGWRPIIEDVDAALATLNATAADLEEREADVVDREARLSALADELDERESALSDREELASRATIRDGITFVGESEEASAGVYRNNGTGPDCSWQISPQGDADEVIDSYSGDATGQEVTLTNGQQFETNGCGTWTGS